MAKKQTFADKLKKKADGGAGKAIRLVYTYKSPETDSWKFADKIIVISPDANEDKVIETEIKTGRTRLESV